MVQLRTGIPDQAFIEQIVMKLNLNGFQHVNVEMTERKAILSLEDLQVCIYLDFGTRKCSVESRQSIGQLKAVSDLVK